MSSDSYILSILDGRISSSIPDGRTSFYSVYGNIISFASIQNGKLLSSGILKSGNKSRKEGKSNACTDWYLITTTYFTNGSKRTTDDYLFTTCDGECNTTRIGGRINCGGGTGGSPGSGYPIFPEYATDGNDYEFRVPDGKLTVYTYKSASNTWSIVYVMLPAYTVQANPNIYPNLLTDSPMHGLTVFDPSENLEYTFDSYTGGWVAEPVVENNIVNECLHNQVENIRDNEIQTRIQEMLHDIFESDNTVMLRFEEITNFPKPARTLNDGGKILHVTTYLNSGILAAASKEYTAIVVYHEIVHGILYSQGKDGELHHQETLELYVDEIATSARSLYPNLSEIDARALSLAGLSGLRGTTGYNSLLQKFQLTNAIIDQTEASYRRDNTEGNVKKGTPCN